MKYIELLFNKIGFSDFAFSNSLSKKSSIIFVFSKIVELIRFNLYCLLSLNAPKVVLLGRNSILKNISYIKFGKLCRIDSFTLIDGLGNKGLILGNRCSIGPFSRIVVSSGLRDLGESIELSDNVGVGSHANIGGSGGVFIGKDTIIGPYFSAHPENHIFSDVDKLIRHQGTNRDKITIGPNCWIGAKVTVLAGVTIGEGCVIAAGSIVNNDIPPYSVVVGAPAKVIKNRRSNV